jgi:BASS family bile acid:Na+ symporter
MQETLRTALGLLATCLMPVLMLSLGLVTNLSDLKRELRQPIVWRGVLVCLVEVPLLAILLARVLPISAAVAGIMLVMAISPGHPMAVRAAERAGGSQSLSVALLVALSLLALVSVPLYVLLLNRLFPLVLEASPWGLTKALAPSLLVPFLLGLGAHRAAPGLARQVARWTRRIFEVAFALAAAAALIVSWRMIREASPWSILALLLATGGAACLGMVAGNTHANRVTLAQAAAFGNPAIALYVASQGYAREKLLPGLIAYVVLRAFVLLPFQRWAGHRKQALA